MSPGPTHIGSADVEEERRKHSQEVCRRVDREGLDVEGSFLKPDGVISNKNERAETDLAAQCQTTTGNHVVGERNSQPHRESLRHLPHGRRQLSWE